MTISIPQLLTTNAHEISKWHACHIKNIHADRNCASVTFSSFPKNCTTKREIAQSACMKIMAGISSRNSCKWHSLKKCHGLQWRIQKLFLRWAQYAAMAQLVKAKAR